MTSFASPLAHGRPHITYLTGPVRSGKSRHAVRLAETWSSHAVFVATYRQTPGDLEMEERVRRHRLERPDWRVLEAPKSPADELLSLPYPPSGVILDSLTLWASDRFGDSDDEIVAAWEHQLGCFRQFPWPIVIVGDEIGWSEVPENHALRRFRDLVGILNQKTAAIADEAWLFVSGCKVRLK